MQLAVCEFARNVLGWEDANSTEFDPESKHPVVNPELKGHFEKKGFHFVGEDVDGERMEVIELDDHPYFVGVQYHPEFTSRPIKPSPPYFGLLLAATGKLQSYLQKGCRLSPR
ncbi:hypothetical protein CRUP_022143 [Coryphaenoides rupestris]|nr:hypothetical protein CRUP_022143 [Coryphaenoides rupestris]